MKKNFEISIKFYNFVDSERSETSLKHKTK